MDRAETRGEGFVPVELDDEALMRVRRLGPVALVARPRLERLAKLVVGEGLTRGIQFEVPAVRAVPKRAEDEAALIALRRWARLVRPSSAGASAASFTGLASWN